MNGRADELVDSYLERLDRELRDLPEARRREVVDEVSEHIVDARSELASESEAEIRNLLDRVGDPAEIAAEARSRFDVRPRGSDWREVSAIVLLLLGGFVGFVGWILGVILLWVSDRWTNRDKLIGTLVVPGGLATSLIVLMYMGSFTLVPRDETGGSSTDDVVWLVVGLAFLLVCVIGPLFTTVYLARRLRRTAPGVDADSAVPTAS